MPAFAYAARDPSGAERRGVLVAEDRSALVERLRRQGWLVLEIEPSEGTDGSAPEGRPDFSLRRPTQADVEHALRQLALMLDSGLTLLDALRQAARHARRRPLRRALERTARRIEQGSSFHEALAGEGRAFPPLVLELVRAGEQSGMLEEALRRAAGHLEKARRLRGQLAHALFYPSIVVALTTLVAGFMVTYVVPKLEGFLVASGKRLPAITQALLDVSHVFVAWGPTLAILLASTMIALLVLDRTPAGRRAIDRALYALPVLGAVRRLASTALFARSLGVLLQNGIPLVHALETVRRVAPRPVLADSVAAALREVEQGRALHEGLEGAHALTPVVVRMVSIGEQSGSLDRVLLDAAGFHEAELERWIRRATVLVEPVLTITVGVIVGFVYIAFFIALFSLAGA